MKVLVTGGAGFIGSAVVRYLLTETDASVVNLDSLTYAGNVESVASVANSSRYTFIEADIRDRNAVGETFARHRPDAVLHLAAESHVDRSIDGPHAFIETNVVGTGMLLDAALEYWRGLPKDAQSTFRFHHVSTDEVYGDLDEHGRFDESSPYRPNSPYSASKAAADHLVRAWHRTYGLPAIISNCSNNYGPYQFPEKLIPLIIIRAISGETLPVYGDGSNVRDWLHVADHAEALWTILTKGRVGEVYVVGGDAEQRNIDVVRSICTILDEALGESPHRPHEQLIEYVTDRPGHDHRYAIDAAKVKSELGWQPRHSFASGLEETVHWYLENRSWWLRVLSGEYRTERLGAGAG